MSAMGQKRTQEASSSCVRFPPISRLIGHGLLECRLREFMVLGALRLARQPFLRSFPTNVARRLCCKTPTA